METYNGYGSFTVFIIFAAAIGALIIWLWIQ